MISLSPFARSSRFGPLTRASYASPALDTTNLPPEQAPARSAGFRRLVFARLTSPACRHSNDFSDTAPTLLPRPQILQPQSVCYPLKPSRPAARTANQGLLGLFAARSAWATRTAGRTGSGSRTNTRSIMSSGVEEHEDAYNPLN